MFLIYNQTQLVALTSEAWQNLSIGTEDIWSNYYIALAHVRDIERRLDAMENPNIRVYASTPYSLVMSGDLTLTPCLSHVT